MTNGGADLRLAQNLFLMVYAITLASVLFLVYRPAKVPPYVLPLLILSKRIHSIYLLRMFNDAFSTLFTIIAIAFLQRRYWKCSAMAISVAVSVKMNALLFLPGFGIIYLQVLGPVFTIIQTAIPFLLVQVLVALPFLTSGFSKEYVGGAFEFSRVFFYKWTVNWRFVPENIFLSPTFALTLLGVHAVLIAAFCTRRGYHWTSLIKTPKIFASSPSAGNPVALINAILFSSPIERTSRLKSMTPDYVLTTVVSSNLIGVLCARSLHYQFYSWFFWTVPFALYKSRSVFGTIPAFAIFAAQEYAWNVYPSTSLSSSLVITSLALMVIGIWIHDQRVGAANEHKAKRQ